MGHMPKTWWGETFVRALEGFIDSGRLQRGKPYRTDKRVLSFDMKQNKVKASILGNANPYFDVYEAPEYNVSITFEAISKNEWKTIIERIAANPSWLSKLMLKEMPANIERGFKGTYLLPSSFKDINAECSCPDHANPCKHIAGVYYRIANMLDANPMLLFQLRGLTTTELINALEKTEFGHVFAQHQHLQPKINLEPKEHKYHPFIASGETKRLSNENIWTMKSIPINSPQKDENHMPAGLIKKQGDFPAFWTKQGSFITAMEGIYKTIKRVNAKNLL